MGAQIPPDSDVISDHISIYTWGRGGFMGQKRRTATEEKDWRHEAGQKGTDTEQHKKISNFIAYVD